MPSAYFSRFSTTVFPAFGTSPVISFAPSFPVKDKTVRYDVKLVDIFPKVRLIEKVLNDALTYYPYVWKSRDRPDTVAKGYYGDEKYYWLVYFSNKAFDLKMDFPMAERPFRDYLFDKYGSDPAFFPTALTDPNQIYSGLNGILHHYETTDGIVLSNPGDSSFTTEYGASSVSYYEYENRINERNRTVKLVSVEHLEQVDYELRRLLA